MTEPCHTVVGVDDLLDLLGRSRVVLSRRFRVVPHCRQNPSPGFGAGLTYAGQVVTGRPQPPLASRAG
ncbi:hypothetical protein Amsp01_041220 [Amycolatopsis sp. NBRC 101858]|nr:hypothetical protein Amsp01_041220 [Amycolatopsis sp. NBRC 101858]